MLVTLSTDGSHYPLTGEAGYAFWISSDVGRFTKYGKLKDARNATEAEAQAIVNGLHFIRNHPQLQHCTKIIVNTDCMVVITLATQPDKFNKKERHKRLRQLRGYIQKYLGKYKGKNCDWDFRHVRAHSKETDSRSYVNNFLDLHAKKGAKL